MNPIQAEMVWTYRYGRLNKRLLRLLDTIRAAEQHVRKDTAR